MFWWIMPSNHHIPAIKWLQEYGVSFCMGDKLPATELQVKRRGSIVLIPVLSHQFVSSSHVGLKTAVSKTRIICFLYFACQFVHLTIV